MLLGGAGGVGCKGTKPPREVSVDAGLAASAPAGAFEAGVDGMSGDRFSLPIAAARVASAGGAGHADVIAAGLVVATASITATRIDASGKTVWARVAIPEVTWSADAEVHAWPITAGAVIVWRGPIGKKNGHVAVVLAPDGHVLDGPIDVGSLVCATDDGLAWSDGARNGASRVHVRSYGPGGIPHDDAGPPTMDDFTLTCGAHAAYEVVEGDEGTATKVFAIGGAPPAAASTLPLVTVAAMALGKDEERDLFFWAEGDELGLVRVASGGDVQAASVRGGALSLLPEKGRVIPEDDVVGVDADPQEVVLVTSHDESDGCPNGRGGSSVHALRIPRPTGGVGAAKATSLLLAPSACGRDVGPFWTNPLGPSLVVGWAERASRPEKTSPPITGLAYRTIQDASTTLRLPQAADAITDAGCDEARCYAVALVRAPGSDGMKPEAMKVLTYP
jgi:hypothetical protein